MEDWTFLYFERFVHLVFFSFVVVVVFPPPYCLTFLGGDVGSNIVPQCMLGPRAKKESPSWLCRTRSLVFSGLYYSGPQALSYRYSLPLRPSSNVVLLPCRTKLQFSMTVARQKIFVVPESNQIQGFLKPRNLILANTPPNYLRERNLAKTH